MNDYYKHKRLDFIIKVTDILKVIFAKDSEWILVKEGDIFFETYIGEVVYDKTGFRQPGYESKDWIPKQFELLKIPLVVDINEEDSMWTVLNLEDESEYYGGWIETGDQENYGIEIEWDCDIPNDHYINEIEKLILKEIQ